MPFETLDAFTTNFVAYLKYKGELFKLHHLIEPRQSPGGKVWQESYVRIDRAGKPSIDVHEFYWAYITEEKIDTMDVLKWAEETLAATTKFYAEHPSLHEAYKGRRHTAKFPLRWIVRALRVLVLLGPIFWIGGGLLSPLFSSTIAKASSKWLVNVFRKVIVGYVGDVAIYTTTDEKSKYYQARQKILEESQTLVEEVLNEAKYDRVIVAGHSLGSVIAYDTLNRINMKVNLREGRGLPIGKLAGLVTFGSPLDKIAFFFRDRTEKGQYVRQQILEHLHSFKSRRLDTQGNAEPLSDPLKPKLDEMLWINFYSVKDPVSGHLDFYKIAEQDNIQLDLPQPWGVAHTGYWTSQEFYDDVARRFFP
jgi:hypothetical protein